MGIDDRDIIETGAVGLLGSLIAWIVAGYMLEENHNGLILGFAVGVLAVCGRLLVASLEDF